MKKYKANKNLIKLLAIILCANLCIGMFPLTAFADEPDYMAQAEERKKLPIQTNEIEGWPAGPDIGAEAAILIDAKTGTILYAKNIDEELYPASTTKIMTCMLAVENCELDEVVTFSHSAVFNIDPGSSNIGMDEGQSITMNQALQGILILSANEVANAVAEHIAGSQDAFADMMNERVEKLGLKHTHFCNPHGLYNPEHYTSAYDLAQIAREFFSYDVLRNISGTGVCTFEATATQPDSFTLASKNQLMKGKPYEYEYLVGSKTGYTSEARQTLVSCARKNGVELICVILKEESPYQFADTVALFNYGFDNFSKVNVAENDKKYVMDSGDFFESGNDIFGQKVNILTISEESYVLIPNNVDFSGLETKVAYESDRKDSVAEVNYYYGGNFVGNAYVKVNPVSTTLFEESEGNTQGGSVTNLEPIETKEGPTTNKNATFINIKWVLALIVVVAGIAISVMLIRALIKDYNFTRGKSSILEIKKRRKYDSNEFSKFTFNGTRRRKEKPRRRRRRR